MSLAEELTPGYRTDREIQLYTLVKLGIMMVLAALIGLLSLFQNNGISMEQVWANTGQPLRTEALVSETVNSNLNVQDSPVTDNEFVDIDLNGSAKVGSTVQILVNDSIEEEFIVDESGAWASTVQVKDLLTDNVTFRTIPPTVSNGEVNSDVMVHGTADGHAGHVSHSVADVMENVPAITWNSNSRILPGTYIIAGTAVPNETLTLWLNGSQIETLDADATGAWETTVTLPDAGSVELIAMTTGDVETASEPILFDVETPVQPSLLFADEDAPLVAHSTADLLGTAESNSFILISIDGETSEVSVSETGEWTHSLQLPHQAGEHELQVSSQSPAGDVWHEATIPLTIITLTNSVIVPQPNQEIFSDTLTVTGTAATASVIQVFVDGNEIGEAEPDAQGNWALDVTFEQSEHIVLVDVIKNGEREQLTAVKVNVLPWYAECETGTTPGERGEDQDYIYGSCDEPWMVALRYGIELPDLIDLNPGMTPDTLNAGDVLILPESVTN